MSPLPNRVIRSLKNKCGEIQKQAFLSPFSQLYAGLQRCCQ